jgi:quercetin dioxygenase-like cupin family protein
MTKKMYFSILVVGLVILAARVCSAQEVYTASIRVQTLLRTSTDVAGQPIKYPTGETPEVSTLLVEIPAGQSTGWHFHPNPCAAYILQGEVTVETETGEKRHFVTGDSFAEVVKLKHCGLNTGTMPVKILLFVIGEKGTPVSQKVEAQK